MPVKQLTVNQLIALLEQQREQGRGECWVFLEHPDSGWPSEVCAVRMKQRTPRGSWEVVTICGE
jgi:hypothetical protein